MLLTVEASAFINRSRLVSVRGSAGLVLRGGDTSFFTVMFARLDPLVISFLRRC